MNHYDILEYIYYSPELNRLTIRPIFLSYLMVKADEKIKMKAWNGEAREELSKMNSFDFYLIGRV